MSQITAAFRQAALRRGFLVKPRKSAQAVEPALAYAATVELANLGFIVDPKELAGIAGKDLSAVISEARTIVGADRDMEPIYPGFPKQVEELSTLTLLVEQILHYWTGGAFLPDYPKEVREGLPLEDMLRNVRELRVMDAADVAKALMASLATSATAISQDDRLVLDEAAKLFAITADDLSAIAGKISNGENLQALQLAVIGAGKLSGADSFLALAPSVKTLDHLLRVFLGGFARPSAEKWRKNFELAVENLSSKAARAVAFEAVPRAARKLFVERAGKLSRGFFADSFIARQDLWRRALKAVHSFEFAKDEASKRALAIVHSNVEYQTLNSLIEAAKAERDVPTAVALLAEHRPGQLLREVVSLLRLVDSNAAAIGLAEALRATAGKARVDTLVSAYSGILGANDEGPRVNRVAGLNNTMLDRSNVAKVDEAHLSIVLDAVKGALVDALASKKAPEAAVAVGGTMALPLVRRDASTADRQMNRGESFGLVGEGDVIRIFGHWNNNMGRNGYMDIGAVLLDGDFKELDVLTWNTWSNHRSWGTYSGDKNVAPGDSAAEFFDLKLAEIRKHKPEAKWIAMTVQSWSGFPIDDVDFIAGAMLRSKDGVQKGEVFDARAVATAFHPTTKSLQAVPFAVDLEEGKFVWVDSSNGSTATGVSSSNDDSIGAIVYDEVSRPRLTTGEFAALWAQAHGAETTTEEADVELLTGLL